MRSRLRAGFFMGAGRNAPRPAHEPSGARTPAADPRSGAMAQPPSHQPPDRGHHRANVVGIFPNETSIRRPIGAVLMEQNEEWLLQPRYLPQHTMADTVLETEALTALPAT